MMRSLARPKRLSNPAHRWLERLADDTRGVSAVEFALILPLMLTLFFGSVELSQGIAADRKVTLTARTISDLVAQVKTIDNNGVNNALNAAAAVMAPYPVSNLKVTVSSIKIDAKGTATVRWSDTLNGTARAPDSTVNIPSGLVVPGRETYLILSEVSYTYTPAVGYVMTGSLTLKDEVFMRPRLTDEVKRERT